AAPPKPPRDSCAGKSNRTSQVCEARATGLAQGRTAAGCRVRSSLSAMRLPCGRRRQAEWEGSRLPGTLQERGGDRFLCRLAAPQHKLEGGVIVFAGLDCQMQQ